MSERQVMPVSAREHFEAVFRQVGTGRPATMNGLSSPLRVIAILRADPQAPVHHGGRIDVRA